MLTSNDILEHHGVKGMKWGIINEEKHHPRASGSHKGLTLDPDNDEEAHSLKFGPHSNDDNYRVPIEKQWGFPSLSPGLKKAALAVGGMALLGAGAYALYRFGGTKSLGMLTNKADISRYCLGLGKHWDEGVDLPAGSTLKRWSTVSETSLRSSGSYFTFKPKDLEFYSNLPQRNGVNPTHLISVKANNGVRAPSGKETFGIYKSMFDDQTLTRMGRDDIVKLKGRSKNSAIEQLAKESFWPFSRNWMNGYDSDPDVQRFFKKVRGKGYNSLIDFFDSGGGADMPIRTLTDEGFAMAGLAQSFNEDGRSFLEHYGVKGMKWGIRNEKHGQPHPGFDNKGHPVHQMSDDELKKVVERLQLEKRYSDLHKDLNTKETTKFLKKNGTKIAASLVMMASTTIGQHFLNEAIKSGKISMPRFGRRHTRGFGKTVNLTR